MKDKKGIIIQKPPNLNQQPRVDFDKSKFDAQVEMKGAAVYWERAIKCPCKKEGGSPHPSCMNCHGLGYIFTDLVATKMIVQSINRNTKNQAWSAELVGTMGVTAFAENQLGFMDRITLQNVETVYNQVVYVRKSAQNKLFGFTVYPLKELDYIGLFQDVTQPLVQLDISNIIVNNNVIYFQNQELQHLKNPVVTLRYRHNPTFNILDLQREVMQTQVVDKQAFGRETLKDMPIHAIARRSQYIFDEENLAQNLNKYDNINDEMKVPG